MTMEFDVSTLQAGQRWAVFYTAPGAAHLNFEFTLVKRTTNNLDGKEDVWVVKDSTSKKDAKIAWELWWQDTKNKPYSMVLLCTKA